MEADECIGNVVGVTQAVDEPCCHVHHRLKMPEKVGKKTGQDNNTIQKFVKHHAAVASEALANRTVKKHRRRRTNVL